MLDPAGQAISALRQMRDVGSAFLTLLLVQTWLTIFTAIMTIISIAFFSYGKLIAFCRTSGFVYCANWIS